MDRTKLEEIHNKHINAYLSKDRMARFEDIPTRIFIDAMEEALHIHDVVGRSEQLPCPHCGQLEPCAGNSPETCYHPKVC
jgi:hypothetical protein